MNDKSNSNGSSNMGPTLVGFALGAIVGAGVALLLAPESGKKTRERLAKTARRLSEDAGATFDQARETVATLGSEAKSAFRAGQEAFLQDLGTQESRTERRLSESGDAAAMQGSALRPGEDHGYPQSRVR